MGRWLHRVQATGRSDTATLPDEKKQISVGQLPYKTYESPSVGSVGKAQGAFPEKYATGQEVETLLASLKTVGNDLGEVESLARSIMRTLTRAAAAEMAAVLDDLFQTAPSADVARSQCQRVLSDPQALAAAKAVWPDLACLPDDSTPALDSAPTVVVHAPRWLRYIRAHCPLVPEDETHLRRYLGSQAPDAAKQAAKRYVTTWQQAAETEPRQTARDNAGRRAANRSLFG